MDGAASATRCGLSHDLCLRIFAGFCAGLGLRRGCVILFAGETWRAFARGTREEIADMVRRNIDDLGRDGGYCVGSSNSVTYYVPLTNYCAMIEAALEYGRLG